VGNKNSHLVTEAFCVEILEDFLLILQIVYLKSGIKKHIEVKFSNLTPDFFLLFYCSYVHTRLGSFLPPAPTHSLTTHSTPSLFPLTPSIPSRNYFALISNFVEERI
jgi:hypothetical protein